MSRLYYNPAAANSDLRTGRGYGKAQKTPSFGTGQGSERSMGSSETGIYTEPPSETGIDDDFGFDDDNLINKLIRKINKKYVKPDPAFWPRADRSSLGKSSNSSAVAALALTEQSPLPKVSGGIAPFSNRVLYPKGFDGPPIGTGGSGQAFRTTGPYKRTGTQYGTSRAPIDSKNDEEDFFMSSFSDIVNLDPAERSLMKQKIKLMKLFNRIDDLDKESEKLLSTE